LPNKLLFVFKRFLVTGKRRGEKRSLADEIKQYREFNLLYTWLFVSLVHETYIIDLAKRSYSVRQGGHLLAHIYCTYMLPLVHWLRTEKRTVMEVSLKGLCLK